MARYRIDCATCPFSKVFDDEEPAKGMPEREQWNACSAAMGALRAHEETSSNHSVTMERLD